MKTENEQIERFLQEKAARDAAAEAAAEAEALALREREREEVMEQLTNRIKELEFELESLKGRMCARVSFLCLC